MAGIGKDKQRFGLVGKNISYSFSRGYFTEKFKKLGLTHHTYENFDLKDLSGFRKMASQTNIRGLNVTIPYKEAILPFLDDLDDEARKIGAVNTIKFTAQGLMGYNTDAYGFRQSLAPLLKKTHSAALVLGTGGASKAIVFVLRELGLDYQHVSRNPSVGQLSYSQLGALDIQKFQLIINCTPVGTFPKVDAKPDLPYEYLNNNHILFDLIYNPSETAFLKEGKQKGTIVQNGLPMLEFQAERAWEIWKSNE